MCFAHYLLNVPGLVTGSAIETPVITGAMICDDATAGSAALTVATTTAINIVLSNYRLATSICESSRR